VQPFDQDFYANCLDQARASMPDLLHPERDSSMFREQAELLRQIAHKDRELHAKYGHDGEAAYAQRARRRHDEELAWSVALDELAAALETVEVMGQAAAEGQDVEPRGQTAAQELET
jgi:hypothetical protein